MPEIVLEIGGRSFELACDPGEEASLKMAAEMLAAEARRLEDAIGRVPESRMLLMAGLMLADRTKEIEASLQMSESLVKSLEARLREGEARMSALTQELNKRPEPEVEDMFAKTGVVTASLEKSIERLEALIDQEA